MSSEQIRTCLHYLEVRRKELRMSTAALAKRSGLPRSTVVRLLSGKVLNPGLNKIAALTEALGVQMTFIPTMSPDELVRQQAEKKARQLVGMVQGTMGLEAQGVDQATASKLFSTAYSQLIQGPRKKLWYD